MNTDTESNHQESDQAVARARQLGALIEERNRCELSLRDAQLELDSFMTAQAYLQAHLEKPFTVGMPEIVQRNQLPARVRKYLPEGRP